MIWTREYYDDNGYYWRCDLGAGEELCVDMCLGDKWSALFYDNGAELLIQYADTEEGAKRACDDWLGRRISRLSNAWRALAQHQDDGA